MRNIKVTSLLSLVLALVSINTSVQAKEPIKASDMVDFYGFLRFESFYDNGEATKGDWLLLVPSGMSAAEGSSVLSMTARHTRFGFNFTAPELEDGLKVTAKLEADFAGGFPNSSTAQRQPQLRLRHAWMQIAKNNLSLRLGQDWALISGPFPNTAAFVAGASKGNLWMRMPQARLTWDASPFVVAVSANRPMAGNVKYDDNASGDLDIVSDGELTGLPWGMGRLWFNTKPAKFSVSGHVGQESVADGSGLRHDLTSWSVNGDVVLAFGPLAFTVRGFYGDNLNTFLGGILQGQVVTASDVENVAAMGGWAQAVAKLNDKWSVTAGTGMDDPDDDDLVAGMRSMNQWVWGNVAYTPVKSLKFIAETEYVSTDYVGADTGEVIRFSFTSYYLF